MKKRMMTLLLAAVLAFSLLALPALAAAPFSDVDPGAWYAEDVAYAAKRGLMDGVADGIFDPEGTTTRAMIVTILHRLEGKPAAGVRAFSDVPADAWYAAAVSWAAARGIVNGVGVRTFAPNDAITREQFAAILYRYAAFKGMDVSKKADLSAFADANGISSWAVDAMAWANAAGLITGTSDKTLTPGGYATRAQAAAILSRFDRMAQGGDATPAPDGADRRVTITIDRRDVRVTDPKQIFSGTFTVENDAIDRVEWVQHCSDPAYDGRTGTAVIGQSDGKWRTSPIQLALGDNRMTFTAVTASGVTAEATLTVRCVSPRTAN